jgi:hypothetical protein
MAERKRVIVVNRLRHHAIVRASLNQTSYARKLVTYLAGGASRLRPAPGIGNFRVLTVTTSAERGNNDCGAEGSHWWCRIGPVPVPIAAPCSPPTICRFRGSK